MSVQNINQNTAVPPALTIAPKTLNQEEISGQNTVDNKTDASLALAPGTMNKNEPSAGKDKNSKEQGNINTIVDKLNQKLNKSKSPNLELEFTIDDKLKTTVIKVLDKETKEVIRQIPSEELLKIQRILDEGADPKGFFVKETA